MSDDPIDDLRRICLALPEATEKLAWEAPTFRMRDQTFAMPRDRDGRPSVWMRAPRTPRRS